MDEDLKRLLANYSKERRFFISNPSASHPAVTPQGWLMIQTKHGQIPLEIFNPNPDELKP